MSNIKRLVESIDKILEADTVDPETYKKNFPPTEKPLEPVYPELALGGGIGALKGASAIGKGIWNAGKTWLAKQAAQKAEKAAAQKVAQTATRTEPTLTTPTTAATKPRITVKPGETQQQAIDRTRQEVIAAVKKPHPDRASTATTTTTTPAKPATPPRMDPIGQVKPGPKPAASEPLNLGKLGKTTPGKKPISPKDPLSAEEKKRAWRMSVGGHAALAAASLGLPQLSGGSGGGASSTPGTQTGTQPTPNVVWTDLPASTLPAVSEPSKLPQSPSELTKLDREEYKIDPAIQAERDKERLKIIDQEKQNAEIALQRAKERNDKATISDRQKDVDALSREASRTERDIEKLQQSPTAPTTLSQSPTAPTQVAPAGQGAAQTGGAGTGTGAGVGAGSSQLRTYKPDWEYIEKQGKGLREQAISDFERFILGK